MNEHTFSAGMAVHYGLEEAVMIKHFQFWIQRNKKNNIHWHDGRTWTYNSIHAFVALFPFWTKKQISRILKSLVGQRVLVKGHHNPKRYDRTTWYAFVDEAAFLVISPNGKMDSSKWGNPFPHLDEPIPDPNTITKSTTTAPVVIVDEVRKIKDIIAGTPLNNTISIAAIRKSIDNYCPEAHVDHQPETPVQGIKRLLRWTVAIMADPRGTPLKNPVGFLIAASKKGMDKPEVLLRQEQAAEAAQLRAIERLKKQKEEEEAKADRLPIEEIRKFMEEFAQGLR